MYNIAMTNSWALLYDELYGTNKMTNTNRITPQESDEYDPIITSGNKSVYNIPTDVFEITEDIKIDTQNRQTDTITGSPWVDFKLTDYPESVSIDTSNCPSAISDTFTSSNYVSDYSDTITLDTSGFDFNISVPDSNTVTFGDTTFGSTDTTTPGIEDSSSRKYKEDEAIKALQDYISTTYGGHYTSKENNVQTLDLIESVGDAESFCRSNAIKYLSRYDKKGQAKRDILKALHYSLLLYHFSGQLNETTTRGYETF